MTADLESDSIRSMTKTISSHLQKAAKDILEASSSSVCTAFWEIQMAVEKVLKAYIFQQGTTPPQTHDLVELLEIASMGNNLSAKIGLLRRLPQPKVVLALRYAPYVGFGIKEAMASYRIGLDLVAYFSAQLKRKITMNSTSVLIKRPPWLGD